MLTGTVILIAAVCLVAGILAGVGAMLMFGQHDTDEASKSRQQLYSDLAHLWRERKSGKLVVEIDGRMHTAPLSLSPEQRNGLVELGKELGTWIGVETTSAPVVKAAPPLPQPASAPVTQPVEAPANLAANAPSSAPVDPARPAGASMVAQIDAILQQNMAGSSLAGRSIRLTEEPRRGVIVWVGLDRYTGVESVPDAEVRAAIRAAVVEWEKQAEGRPG